MNTIKYILIFTFLQFIGKAQKISPKAVPDSIVYQVYPHLQDAILSFRISNLQKSEKDSFNLKYFPDYQYNSDLSGLEYLLSGQVEAEKIGEYHLIFDSIKFINVKFSTDILNVYKSTGLKFTNYPFYPFTMNAKTKEAYSKFKYDTIYISDNPTTLFNDNTFTVKRNRNTNCKSNKKYFVLSGSASLDVHGFFCDSWDRKTDLLRESSLRNFIRSRSTSFEIEDLTDVKRTQINYDTVNFFGYFGYFTPSTSISPKNAFITAPKKMKLLIEKGIEITYYTNDTLITKDSLKNLHKITYHLDVKSERLSTLRPSIIKYSALESKNAWLSKQIIGDIFDMRDYTIDRDEK